MYSNHTTSQEVNFQYYVDMVKQKEIAWHVFVKLMEDLSFWDVNRLKNFNAILLNELSISNSDMDRLKYLNGILMTKFKDSIQTTDENTNAEKMSEKKDSIEDYQISTLDFDLNDEPTKETSSDDTVVTLHHNHVENFHGSDHNNKCASCGKSFISVSSLKRHIHAIHKDHKRKSISNHSKECKCEICGKSFKDTSLKKRHVTQVHLNQLKFKCDTTCSKSFVSKGILRLHQSIHSGETFVCNNISQKEYKRKDTLVKYKCNICDKFFINASTQKQHVTLVHKKI